MNDRTESLGTTGGTGEILIVMKGVKISGSTSPLDKGLRRGDLGQRSDLIANVYRIPENLLNRDNSPLRDFLLMNGHGTGFSHQLPVFACIGSFRHQENDFPFFG